MNWILIAITSGMFITGHYDTEEACFGRKAILEKDKITNNAKCIDMRISGYNSISGYSSTNGIISLCGSNTTTFLGVCR